MASPRLRPRIPHRFEVIDLDHEPAALVQQVLHASAWSVARAALRALHAPVRPGWLVKTSAMRVRAYEGRRGVTRYAITVRHPSGRPHFFRARYVDLYPFIARLSRDEAVPSISQGSIPRPATASAAG